MCEPPNSRPLRTTRKRGRRREHGATTRTRHGGSTRTQEAAAYCASVAGQSPNYRHQVGQRSGAEAHGAQLNVSLSSPAMAELLLVGVRDGKGQ